MYTLIWEEGIVLRIYAADCLLYDDDMMVTKAVRYRTNSN